MLFAWRETAPIFGFNLHIFLCFVLFSRTPNPTGIKSCYKDTFGVTYETFVQIPNPRLVLVPTSKILGTVAVVGHILDVPIGATRPYDEKKKPCHIYCRVSLRQSDYSINSYIDGGASLYDCTTDHQRIYVPVDTTIHHHTRSEHQVGPNESCPIIIIIIIITAANTNGTTQ